MKELTSMKWITWGTLIVCLAVDQTNDFMNPKIPHHFIPLMMFFICSCIFLLGKAPIDAEKDKQYALVGTFAAALFGVSVGYVLMILGDAFVPLGSFGPLFNIWIDLSLVSIFAIFGFWRSDGRFLHFQASPIMFATSCGAVYMATTIFCELYRSAS